MQVPSPVEKIARIVYGAEKDSLSKIKDSQHARVYMTKDGDLISYDSEKNTAATFQETQGQFELIRATDENLSSSFVDSVQNTIAFESNY